MIVDLSDDDIRRAQDALDYLMPLARLKAEGDVVKLELSGPAGPLVESYLRIENVVGVHIYARYGGWHAKVLLDSRKLPKAAPNAVARPIVKTREEAEAEAVDVLASLIAASREPAAPFVDNGERWFTFFGLGLQMPLEMEEMLALFVKHAGVDPADGAPYWLARLDTLKRESFGDGAVTAEKFYALPESTQRRIWMCCGVVWSRLHLLRYPDYQEPPP